MNQVIPGIARLNEIGIKLSAEKDITLVCDNILKGAMELTNADGGSLYRMSDDLQALEFTIVATHSLDIYMGGSSDTEIRFPPVQLYTKGKPNRTNVVSCAVHDDRTINIPDVYHADGFDFSGTKKFDQQTGYRTQSILTIPMKNHEDDIIGVLQLINSKDEVTGETNEFAEEDRELAESLASQAAIALTNTRLMQELKELFEAFIELIAGAIDEKSPYTGGHCRRVPELTMMIADACIDKTDGHLKDFHMTDKDRYELKIAGWLHDCGKVTTPEHVVDKATKLETIYDRINTIDTRFEILKRDAKINMLEHKLSRHQRDSDQGNSDINMSDLEKSYEQKIKALNEDREFIRSSNIGGEFMDKKDQQKVREIAEYRWISPDSGDVMFLDADEVENLVIQKGTLTRAERKVVNNHIVVTIKMLNKLPFPRHMTKVSEYAGGHHERMDGKGYPLGLTREQLSIPARMMAIADIFEALSASDRPYKSTKKLTECLRILGFMKQDNHIDPDIFDIFVREKVYLRYAEEFLPEDQIDEVDVSQIPGYDP